MASESTGTQPKSTGGKVLSPTSLAHVVLRTAHFKPMVAFYKTFLGAHASHENDFLAFLTYDEEHHRIAIASVPGAADAAAAASSGARAEPRASGLEHIAFAFPTLGDLLLAYQQRKALGILPLWSVNHGPTMSIYYQDPDGNQIETQTDVFASVEECNAFMQSDEFAENPIGVDFDPEELIVKLQKGEDAKKLVKRDRVGPRQLESIPLFNPPVPDVRENYGPVEAI